MASSSHFKNNNKHSVATSSEEVLALDGEQLTSVGTPKQKAEHD